MKIKIVNKSKNELPAYSTIASAWMDLRANISKDIILEPLKRVLVPTGLFLEIPEGHEAQIRPKSGLAINKGIIILNSPGTIDSGYRGEVCIIMINLSDQDFIIKDRERIGQMIIAKHEKTDWIEVDILRKTKKGDGGF
jgi:dUTP pyrophosphatase